MYRVGLAIFILLACLSDMAWLHQNVAPPRMWDDSSYLAESVVLYRTLQESGLKAFLVECSKPSRGGHPPMMKILSLPFYFIFQPSTNAALYAYTFLIIVFYVYLFLLTRLLLNSEKIALLAVIITCLLPL